METMLFAATPLLLSFPIMLLLWAISLKTKNVGIIDIGWAFGLMSIQAFYFFKLSSPPFELIFLFAVSLLGSSRLFYYLLKRFRGMKEDPRYTEIKLRWGGGELKFVWVFLFQAIVLSFVSLPFFLLQNYSQNISEIGKLVLIIAGLIAAFGLLIEAIADRQLAKFLRSEHRKISPCSKGLWAYSRHPNYLGQIIFWLGILISMFAIFPYGAFGFISFVLMVQMLINISGVKVSEKRINDHIANNRRPGLKSYVETTPCLIPIIGKKGQVYTES